MKHKKVKYKTWTRGANQSVETKWASFLVKDAIEKLKLVDVCRAIYILEAAQRNLPE